MNEILYFIGLIIVANIGICWRLLHQSWPYGWVFLMCILADIVLSYIYWGLIVLMQYA